MSKIPFTYKALDNQGLPKVLTFLLILVASVATVQTVALAHPGGQDAKGGHYNRKTGEYHCHKAKCFEKTSTKTSNPARISKPESEISNTSRGSFFVTEVVDGDTLKLSSGETVRLIGVDTPETKHPTKPVQYFGKEASAFLKQLAEGKTVRLEYDQQRTDKYGRTLAYIYLVDGRMMNAEIIKQGYGFAYTRFPFKYMEEFRAFEREAREARRGLWADRIYLKDGRSFEGEITSETDEAVKVKRQFGTGFVESTYPKANIDRIESPPLDD